MKKKEAPLISISSRKRLFEKEKDIRRDED